MINKADADSFLCFLFVLFLLLFINGLKLSNRMGIKGDLSDFECGVIVDTRLAGLSISETAEL